MYEEKILALFPPKKNGRAFKLSIEQIRELVQLTLSRRFSSSKIGRMFHVHHATVLRYKIILGLPHLKLRKRNISVDYSKKYAEKEKQKELARLAWQDYLKESQKPSAIYEILLKNARSLRVAGRDCKHDGYYFFKCLICFHVVGSERGFTHRYQCAHLNYERRCSGCGFLLETHQEPVYSM